VVGAGIDMDVGVVAVDVIQVVVLDDVELGVVVDVRVYVIGLRFDIDVGLVMACSPPGETISRRRVWGRKGGGADR
jgi:hypothetical protein